MIIQEFRPCWVINLSLAFVKKLTKFQLRSNLMIRNLPAPDSHSFLDGHRSFKNPEPRLSAMINGTLRRRRRCSRVGCRASVLLIRGTLVTTVLPILKVLSEG